MCVYVTLHTARVGLDIRPKYEYDSDEDTDGGTWEHKKREKEMIATRGCMNSPYL